MSDVILKPETLPKSYRTDPTITVIRKGLIDITPAARKLLPGSCFYFVHIAEERTTFMVPSPDGYCFREDYRQRHLLLNHSELARAILSNNGGTQSKSVRFRLPNPVTITVENRQVQAWPLILQRR